MSTAPVPPRLASVDHLVRRHRKAWNVPGVAVAVIRNGQIIHASGYGWRDVRRQLPVTPHTLFPIGSTTKTFTAALVAMLVAEGQLEWDRPVREHLSWFRLQDHVATRETTLRDILSHQVGMAAHNDLNPLDTRRQRLRCLRHLGFARPFRSGFRYSNKMFLVAGAMIEQVTGTSWETGVRQRIFEPLQMVDSCFACDIRARPDRASAGGDFAVGYVDSGGRSVPSFRGWMRHMSVADLYRSCGADQTTISSLSDLCRWGATHLSASRRSRPPLCAADTLGLLYVPQVSAAGIWQNAPEQADTCCGMGWFVQTYRRRSHIFHGGAGAGWSSLVSILPEEDMGVVVLCNQISPMRHALCVDLYDHLLRLEPVDWIGRTRRHLSQRPTSGRREESHPTRRTHGISPTRDLRDYAGTYRHPGYGRLSVSMAHGRLVARLGPVRYCLKRNRGDEFGITEQGLHGPLRLAEFLVNSKGTIVRLAVRFEPQVPDVIFRRVRQTCHDTA